MGISAAVAAVGATVYTSSKSASAAKDAAKTQGKAADQGIAEQQRQFDQMVELLSPYNKAGTGALNAQQNLLGLNGNNAQEKALKGIENSEYFQTTARQGEDAILQNASATGGLRGGNAQAALGQFRPALLNSLVNQQYTNLGGLTSLGQNSAAQTGNAGMQSANNISALLQQKGQAQAGGIIGAQNAQNQGINQLFSLGGAAYGSGAF